MSIKLVFLSFCPQFVVRPRRPARADVDVPELRGRHRPHRLPHLLHISLPQRTHLHAHVLREVSHSQVLGCVIMRPFHATFGGASQGTFGRRRTCIIL